MVGSVLTIMVSMALGAYLGSSRPDTREIPEKWEPKQHKEMLRQCGVTCGRQGMRKYDILSGVCKCRKIKGN